MDRREFVLRGMGVLAGASVAAGGLLACGDGGGTGLNGGGNGNGNGGDGDFDGTINLTSQLTFDPAEVTINVGDTITWQYTGGSPHTITPGSGPGDDNPHNEWERQEMDQIGQTFEHTFNNAGTFDYYCEPHFSDGMTGTIVVESM